MASSNERYSSLSDFSGKGGHRRREVVRIIILFSADEQLSLYRTDHYKKNRLVFYKKRDNIREIKRK
jgi:hypothetical protein